MSISISTFVLGPIENNTYLLTDSATQKAALIDPSSASEQILKEISENNLDLEFILITHAHFDHIGGVKWFINHFNNDLKVALHPSDLPLWVEGGGSKDFGFDLNVGSKPNLFVSHQQILKLGATSIRVLHTPGHTPGHVTFSIWEDEAAFCGDLIFYHGVGRTDLVNSNNDDLMDSIRDNILTLNQNTTLYPGHGPSTTVHEEMENNPFL